MSKRKPGIAIDVGGASDEWVCAYFIGFADELTAASIATEEMLQTPKPRNDQHGQPYDIQRYFILVNGQPVRRYRIFRRVAYALAIRIPGVPQALAVFLKRQKDMEEREAQREAEDWPPVRAAVAAAPRKRPDLRLVVDNTQEAAS